MKTSDKAFTLVEIIVATFLVVLMVGMTLVFFIKCLNDYEYNSNRLLINKDVRKLTQDMTNDAVGSNYFRVYRGFTERSSGTGAAEVDAPVATGATGDFLVLFSQKTDADGTSRIIKVVAYYRNATVVVDPSTGLVTSSTPGPVCRVEWNDATGVNPNGTYNGSAFTMLAFLNTIMPKANVNSYPVVVQLAQGLGNGMLFYNFNRRSIIVRGQLQEEGNLKYTKTANTYNFTIAPRG